VNKFSEGGERPVEKYTTLLKEIKKDIINGSRSHVYVLEE
jgi:hypothetical protein